MSVTYTDDTVAPRSFESDQEFVPSYARRSTRKTKKVRTWMVLAPIAAIALIGGGAAMLMNSGTETQPLAEPAPAPVVATPAPVVAQAPMVAASTPAPVVTTPAPVVRTAAPVRQSAPVARREAPAVRAAAPRASTSRTEAVVPTTPQPYSAAASTSSVTAAPMARPTAPAPAAVTPPAPAIVVAPLN